MPLLRNIQLWQKLIRKKEATVIVIIVLPVLISELSEDIMKPQDLKNIK